MPTGAIDEKVNDGHSWTLVIPLVPPLLNRWQRMHWAERQEVLELWGWHMKAATRTLPKLERVELDITVYFPQRRKRDWDNMAVAFKIVQDCLVTCNVLPDDDPSHILRPRFPDIQVDRENPRTEITLQK